MPIHTAFEHKYSFLCIGLIIIMAFSLVLWVGCSMGTNSLIFIKKVDVSVEKNKEATEGSVGIFKEI